MTDYIFQDKTDLVNHLFDKLSDASPIKIQKTLYFLFMEQHTANYQVKKVLGN